jgi:hypothetical protein
MTTDETIYSTAINDGMPPALATLIVSQARHETGGYTSRAFTELKNCFGYSYVSGAKWQLSTPGFIADNGQALARYASITNSTHELTDWIKRRQREGVFPANLATIVTPDQYAQLLKNSGYYGDTVANYTRGLVYWLTQITNLVTPGTGLIVVLLLGLGILAYRKKLFR